MSTKKIVMNQTKVSAKVTNVNQTNAMPKKESKTVRKEVKSNTSAKKKTKEDKLNQLMMMTNDDEMSMSEYDSEEEKTPTKVKEADEEIKKILKRLSDLEKENFSLKKSLVDSNDICKELEVKLRDKQLEMPFVKLEGKADMMQIMMEMEKSKDFFNSMRSEYMRTKSFLVQRNWEKLMMKASRKNRDPMEMTHVHNKHATTKCMCKFCFENKVIKLEMDSSRTILDLSMFGTTDLKMEMDTAGMRVQYLKDEDKVGSMADSIQIEDVKFQRTPIKITFGSMSKMRLSMQMVKEQTSARIPIQLKHLNIDTEISLRVFFIIKSTRDWLVSIDNYRLESDIEDTARLVELDEEHSGDCFVRFFKECIGSEFNTDLFTKRRHVTSLSDLTFEEEVVLMDSIRGTKVYIRFRSNDKKSKINHISTTPFTDSIEMDAMHLINPFYRSINFYASDDMSALSLNNEFDDDFLEFHRDEIYDDIPEFDDNMSESETEEEVAAYLTPSVSSVGNINLEEMSNENTNKGKSSSSTMNRKILPKGLEDSIETEKAEREKILNEIKEMEEAGVRVSTLKNRYNDVLTNTFSKSLSALLNLSPDMESMAMSYTGPMIPSHQMKSLLAKNMTNKGIDITSIPILVDNKMMYQIFSMGKENYPYNYFKLMNLTYDEFILMAFFWNDLKDFAQTVMFKDLKSISDAREKLPDYMNYLLKNKIFLDPKTDNPARSMMKLAKAIRSSAFNETKRSTVRSMYVFFQLRMYMGINNLLNSKDTDDEFQANSWADVRQNNLINLNNDSNKNSWYKMFQDRMADHKMKYINGITISVQHKLDPKVVTAIRNVNYTSYLYEEEEKLFKGMWLLSHIIAMWSISVTQGENESPAFVYR